MWWLLPVLVVVFCLVHLCKMMRLYLVLMEHRIGFSKFMCMYFRTTFINLIVPYKLGEIYRFVEISKLTNVWQVGILSVFLDRFFDIFALLLVLIPFDLMMHAKLTIVTLVMLAVILVLAAVYLCIMPTYTYLNRYIIRAKTSKRALMALRGLDVVKQWYDFTKNLITGRAPLIILASLAGWILEVGVLKLFAMYFAVSFEIGDFASYIRAIFVGGTNPILMKYTAGGAVVILAVGILVHMIYFIGHFKKKASN